MAMQVTETTWGTKQLACDCATNEIRFRLRNNGVGAYVYQCLTCGREMRQIGKNTPEVQALATRTPFDESLLEGWQRKLRLFHELQFQQRQQQRIQEEDDKNAEWWRQYTAYLKTPQWAEKRRLVLERDKYVCQGCLRSRASHVHHLTYEHVRNELLFELISLCTACHRRIHPHMG